MKKRLISIAISIVVFAAFFGLIAPVQAGMYTVQGHVYDTDGVTPVDGVDVTVTDINTSDSLSDTTKWGGFYSVVFGWPATADVTAGDTLEIVATYGTLTNTTTVTATGVSPQIVDLILQAPAPEPPEIVSYNISNYVITPSAPTTEIDVEFSERVTYTIAIEKDAATIYDWIGTAKHPEAVWNGTYEENGTDVPDGGYTVNVTGTNTTTGLSVPFNNTQIITVDRTAPTVTPVSPEDGATKVSRTTTISATFSEAMNKTSVEEAFSVDGVTGEFSWAGNKMTFTPSNALAYNTKYTVTVSTTAKDEAGNPLAVDYWAFTTKKKTTGGGGAPRDSDNDGYTDIQEMLAGTDENDPCDPDTECAACLATKPAATPTPTAAPAAEPTAKPTTPPAPKPTAEPTAEPTPTEEPGFEAVFAIAGLLAVAYLVLRRKRK